MGIGLDARDVAKLGSLYHDAGQVETGLSGQEGEGSRQARLGCQKRGAQGQRMRSARSVRSVS
jgi:hypothetical protein